MATNNDLESGKPRALLEVLGSALISVVIVITVIGITNPGALLMLTTTL